MGGRGASSNRNSRMNFTIKKDTPLKGGGVIPKGTKITNVVEIAGGKRKRKVDEVKVLAKKYQTDVKGWSKRRGTAVINGEKIEVHYYQKDKIGKVEFKKK